MMDFWIQIFLTTNRTVGRTAQSVYRLATGWNVRGSNPGIGEIFRTCPDRPPGDQPDSCSMCTGYYPGVKSGRGVKLALTSFECRGQERVKLYLYSSYGAVRPVQSFSACTVQLYLYSPYGPYGLYRTSVPVQYSYTSTPPMGRTAFTEPQCLYSTAIPLLPL